MVVVIMAFTVSMGLGSSLGAPSGHWEAAGGTSTKLVLLERL